MEEVSLGSLAEGLALGRNITDKGHLGGQGGLCLHITKVGDQGEQEAD